MIYDFIQHEKADVEAEKRMVLNLNVKISQFRNHTITSSGIGKFD